MGFILVKSYITKDFAVELVRDDLTGEYLVKYETIKAYEYDRNTKYGIEWINSFETASYLFDIKIKDLEEQ